jgi:hypothetical protein
MIMKHYKFLLLLFIFSPTYSFSQMKPLFEAPAGVAYENIQWPWFDKDSEFAKKREAAVYKLKAERGEFISPHIRIRNRFLKSDERVLETLQFRWDSVENGSYINGAEPTWVPSDVTDDLLRETLLYLPELKRIMLPMTSVTDEGVRLFSCLKYLEDVRFLSGDPQKIPVRITPKSLEILAKQNNLKNITLIGVNFNDKDIQCLVDMKSLESIYISHCPLTSECFRTLVRIPNLKKITMSAVDFSAAIDDEVANKIASGDCKWTDIDMQVDISEKLVKSLMKIKTLKYIELLKVPPKDSWEDIAAMERIMSFNTISWPPTSAGSGRKPDWYDPDWVRFYATKIKPPASAQTIRFWYRQLDKSFPEMDAWVQEAEQRDKEKLLQRE